MPNIEINLVALIVATAVNMLVGYIWYSPALFGTLWQKLVGLTDKDIKQGDQVTPMVIMTGLAFVQTFILLHFIIYVAYFHPDYSNLAVALKTGSLLWLGFVLPSLGGAYIFAKRRKKLLAIDSLYSLLALLASGVILSVWR